MAIWEAIHDENETKVRLHKWSENVSNEWLWDDGECYHYYIAETERQAREALVERLQTKVREFERVIAIEQTRLT